jgi:hypothetical protein
METPKKIGGMSELVLANIEVVTDSNVRELSLINGYFGYGNITITQIKNYTGIETTLLQKCKFIIHGILFRHQG